MAQAVSQVEFENFLIENEEQNNCLEATQLKYSQNIKEKSKHNKYKLF